MTIGHGTHILLFFALRHTSVSTLEKNPLCVNSVTRVSVSPPNLKKHKCVHTGEVTGKFVFEKPCSLWPEVTIYGRVTHIAIHWKRFPPLQK